MKVYGNYTAKKLKLPRRLLFFTLCAVLIFVFALVLGNDLRRRMNEAEIDRTPVETLQSESGQQEEGLPEGNAVHSEEKLKIKAGYLNVSCGNDKTELFKRIDGLKASGFNCLSLTCVENGKLVYSSQALGDHTRLPLSNDAISVEMLSSCVEYAKSKGMAASAFYEKGESREMDMLIAAELALIGFDEIIVSGFEDMLSKEGGDISYAVEFLSSLRSVAREVDISVRLSPDAFVYARNSYHIEKLFTYAEFFSMDITDYEEESAADLAEKIGGSFSVYRIRPFISGESVGVAEALKGQGIEAVQYASAIPASDGEDTTGEKDD